MTQSGSALFELKNLPTKIVVDNVYLNSLHYLHPFLIQNTSSIPLLIKMRSNIPSQLSFQLSNENYTIQADGRSSLPQNAKEYSTPTPINAYTSTSTPSRTGDETCQNNFNELFNSVNCIDELNLEAGEQQELVLTFLPDSTLRYATTTELSVKHPYQIHRPSSPIQRGSFTEKVQSQASVSGVVAKDESQPASTIQQGQQPGPTSGVASSCEDSDTYDFFELNGLIFISAYKMTGENGEEIKSERERISSETPLDALIMKKHIMAEEDIPDSGSPSLVHSPFGTPGTPVIAQNKHDMQQMVKFKAKICRSFLSSDIDSSEISFDDCIVGSTLFKDFTIWNRSEIPLHWALNVGNPCLLQSGVLSFLDYDSGDILVTEPIGSYSHRRVRLRFRPVQVGEVFYDIQLENVNDPTNVEYIRLHANVRSTHSQESLAIVCPNSVQHLDFGDCYAGLWSSQSMTVKNVSQNSLELNFSSDAGTEMVNFSVKTNTVKESSILEHTQQSATPVTGRETSLMESPLSSGANSPTFRKRNLDKLFSNENLIHAFAEKLSNSEGKGSTESKEETGEIPQIEELVIPPGAERTIIVNFKPAYCRSIDAYQAGRLVRQNFRVNIEYSILDSDIRERKTIQCKSRTCTSFIEVHPTKVNYGDTDVWTLKSATITVVNRAELPAQFRLQFMSKVLNAYNGIVTIPPFQSKDIKIDIYPRKINPDYRKQITVVNCLNRENDQIIEVRSTNVDKHRVTFHSLFYRILTPTSINFLDFGSIVINSPTIRSFMIQNISKKSLTLELSTSLPDEIKLYSKSDAETRTNTFPTSLVAKSNLNKLQSVLEELEQKHGPASKSSRKNKTSSTSTAGSISATANTQKSHAKNDTDARTLRSSIAKKRMNSKKALFGHESVQGLDWLDLAGNVTGTKSKKLHFVRRRYRKPSGSKQPTQTVPPRVTAQNFEKLESMSYQKRVGSLQSALGSEAGRMSKVDTPQGTKTPSVQGREKFDDISIISFSNQAEVPETTEDVSTHESIPYPLDLTLGVVEHANSLPPPPFPCYSAEERFIKYQMSLRRELYSVIAEKRLLPVSTLSIPPDSQRLVVCHFWPLSTKYPLIQDKARKQDARVFCKLVEFDRDIENTEFENLLKVDQNRIPVRELMVRGTMFRSVMDLEQKHINFGYVSKNERLTKTIVIRNRSEAPLFYTIKKSGSIASDDIILSEGSVGVVRGYAKREVEFIFDPSLAGQFHEKLVIENLQDASNNQVLSVKALIRKQTNFFIRSLWVDFGVCIINERCNTIQPIVISNTSTKQTRTFEIHADANELRFFNCIGEFSFEIFQPDENSGQAVGVITKEMEEKIENYEQKLKIARRKGREDKVKKIEMKIQKLKRGEADEENWSESKEDAPVVSNHRDSAENGSTGFVFDQSLDKKLIESIGGLKKQEQELKLDNVISIPKSSGVSVPLSPLPPLIPKAKRSKNSILVSLEPNSVKTIMVSFQPWLINSYSDLQQETCCGRIYVNEYRNTDVVKKITFRSIVCYDHDTYLQALETEALITEQGDGFIEDEGSWKGSHYQSENASSVDRLTRSNTQLSLMSGGLNDEVPFSTTFDSPRESPSTSYIPDDLKFTIVNKVVDLGKVELNKLAHGYVLIRNVNSQRSFDLTVEKVQSEISIVESSGAILDFSFTSGSSFSLRPSESRRCEFQFVPIELGRGTFSVVVKSDLHIANEEAMAVHYHVLQPKYLNFPGLPIDGAELNLGFCYVNPNVPLSKVVPLEVENIANEDLWITVQSNLQNQVFIMPDSSEDKKKAVIDHPLPKSSKVVLWVGVQPSFPVASTPTPLPLFQPTQGPAPSAKPLEVAESRHLIGGIKFLVSSMPDTKGSLITDMQQGHSEFMFLVTETVRFNAVVGRSQMHLSTSLIDFGVTDSLEITFPAEFWICNLSSLMPLEYEIEADQEVTFINPPPTTLPGWDTHPEHVTSKALIQFQVTSKAYGYLNKLIRIRNKHNPGQMSTVELRLFVDPKLLCIRAASSNLLLDKEVVLDDDSMQFGFIECGLQLPSLRWNQVYLSPNPDQAELSYEISRPVFGDLRFSKNEKIIEIVNTSDSKLCISSVSDFGLHTHWLQPHDLTGIDEGHEQEPSSVSLSPMQQRYLLVKCPSPAHVLLSTSGLDSGSLFNAKGVLKLLNSETNEALKVLSLDLSYCVSLGELSPSAIVLGEFGHTNRWRNVKFKFTIRNTSDIPLVYKLEASDFVSISSGDLVQSRSLDSITSHDVEDESDLTIQPRETIDMTGTLRAKSFQNESAPKKISGSISLVNKYNQRNVSLLSIEASLTLFEIKFDGLVHGELILPPISFPQSSSTPPADTWFTVVNTSDHDVAFEVGMNFQENIARFLKVDIRSRFSNSPLTGLINLGPKGAIEVRVLVFPNEESRLLPDDLAHYLSNPLGFLFGKLWICTKQINQEKLDDNDGESKMAEDILVKGSIVETNTFSLSDTALTFKTKVYSDSDGEASDENLMASYHTEGSDQVEGNENKDLQQETVIIYNLSDTLPLHFRVSIEGPSSMNFVENLRISPIDDNMCGIVQAGGKLPLMFEWFDLMTSSSEVWKVHIHDINSISKQFQTITIAIVPFEFTRKITRISIQGQSAKAIAKPGNYSPSLEMDTATKEMLSTSKLLLRGCRHIKGDEFDASFGERYELDLGQQDLTTATITKKLLLKNLRSEQITYRIRALSSQSNSKPWITVTPTEGTLDPVGDDFKDTNVIILNIFPVARSVFVSYIIIENLNCPTDSKSIRVSMEVIETGNIFITWLLIFI
jgi:predicted DNA-binding protein YlxM (UPF0122 family)